MFKQLSHSFHTDFRQLSNSSFHIAFTRALQVFFFGAADCSDAPTTAEGMAVGRRALILTVFSHTILMQTFTR